MGDFITNPTPTPPTPKTGTRMLNAAEVAAKSILPDDVNDINARLEDVRVALRPVLYDDAGTMPVKATGSTTARTLAQRAAEVLNVKDFGAKGDGTTNDTLALKAAFAAAALRPGARALAPAGVYLVDAPVGSSNAINIPAGVTLEGEGYNTVFRVNAAGVTGNGRRYVFKVGGDCRLSKFRFDGNRGAVNRAPITSSQFYCIALTASNVVAEDLWLHDVLGIANESFGLVVDVDPTSNIVYRRCKGWNVEGTPFHLNGTIDAAAGAAWAGALLATDCALEDCEAWDNDWMGVSFYGASKGRVQGGRFFRNAKHGINIEWARDVDVLGAVAFNNGRAGIGGYANSSWRAVGCSLYGNNTQALSDGGEFRIASGAWHTGSILSNSGPVTISGCTVRPSAGSRHLWAGYDAAVTFGAPTPESITLQQADAGDWVVSGGTSAGTAYFNYPSARILGAPVLHPLHLGRLADMDTGGGITLAAYAGAGNRSPGAITLSGATQFRRLRTQRDVFKPGRTYLVRMRVKHEDAASGWSVHAEAADASKLGYTRFLPTAAMVGVWQEHDALVSVPSSAAGDYHLRVMQLDSVASAFSVDYLDAVELMSASAHSDAIPFAGRLVGAGAAAPTTGTWTQRDVWLNDSPASAGNLGWVCTASGTPGTWAEFGHISADTNNPAFSTVTLTGTELVLSGNASQVPDFDTTADSSDGASSIATLGAVIKSEDSTRRVVRFRAGGSNNKAGSGGVAWGNFDSDDILAHRLAVSGPLRFDKLSYVGGASNDVLVNILRMDATGTSAKLGFFGVTETTKPVVTGSRGGNAALTSLLTALATLGLITDSTTA